MTGPTTYDDRYAERAGDVEIAAAVAELWRRVGEALWIVVVNAAKHIAVHAPSARGGGGAMRRETTRLRARRSVIGARSGRFAGIVRSAPRSS